MPFGAEVREGGVRFRIWAPDTTRIELLLGDPAGHDVRTLELRRDLDGFWEREEAAAPGALYRYLVDGKTPVPDPASRFQPRDVHGPGEVVDPRTFSWTDGGWTGRPWEETVLYELHVGGFSRQGDYDGIRRQLDRLAALGVTAVELMPIAAFPGRRNWGYDGVLPFAPAAPYGRPEDLKRLVCAAHQRGLAVFLDVVYNHFGPEGNYLHLYARSFFDPRRRTPWGDAVNFDAPGSRFVREFFIHNALYWLEEYHLDGLRLDAVHAIHDDSSPGFLEELARRVHAGPGAERQVHLVLENDANEAHRMRASGAKPSAAYDAQWNDDVHHALHCLLTGEDGGYYADFAADPPRHLARSLAEGFAWQGDHSPYRGAARGEPSSDLPPTAFVNFLQNHDQIGNRAFGERLTALVGEEPLAAAVAILLLAPSPPLLFMGEEYGSRRPFPFFCDFGPDLARSVTEGRRREFARFPEFADPATRERIPDPGASSTFEGAVLDEAERESAVARRWRERHRALLDLRRREIVPRLAGATAGRGERLDERSLRVAWTLGDGARLTLVAHLGPGSGPPLAAPPGRRLWPGAAPADRVPLPRDSVPLPRDGAPLPPWSVLWFLDEGRG
ncbi:MAG: malto-oligosyltrehalose trehalohydrolase [Acidobacteriota bacterium]|jgi:malto-oligosyltrehalose trehalohydrolase